MLMLNCNTLHLITATLDDGCCRSPSPVALQCAALIVKAVSF